MKNKKDTKSFEVFIVLHWFWEGDGYLVNSYKDCFLTQNDAISLANTLKHGDKIVKIYLPNDKIPKESDGGCGTPSFVQVIRKQMKSLSLTEREMSEKEDYQRECDESVRNDH